MCVIESKPRNGFIEMKLDGVNLYIEDTFILVGCEKLSKERFFNITEREILELGGRQRVNWYHRNKHIVAAAFESEHLTNNG